MKKIIAFLMAMMLMLGCCAFAETEEEIHIGICAPATSHGWVGGVAYFAKLAADETGVKYEYVTCTDNADMADKMLAMKDLGVDGIVVWPQAAEGLEEAAKQVLDAGIVLYNFDSIISISDPKPEYADLSYILTGDNYGMGVAYAEYVAEKLEGAGKVVVLNKPSAGNVNADRCAGYYDTIATLAPDIEVLGEYAIEFNREIDKGVMADVLTANPEIDAVISLDDETSIGALQAITEANRTDIKAITGGGGCQAYFNLMLAEENKDINVASMTYSPDMIQHCVYNIVSVLKGETIEHNIVFPTSVVDKTNVAEFLNENSPY